MRISAVWGVGVGLHNRLVGAKMTTQPLDHTFTARIQKDGAFATFVTVPGAADLLGTRRPVKVGGTIDGHPFTATLMPSGNGPYRLPIKAACASSSVRIRPASRGRSRLEQRLS